MHSKDKIAPTFTKYTNTELIIVNIYIYLYTCPYTRKFKLTNTFIECAGLYMFLILSTVVEDFFISSNLWG